MSQISKQYEGSATGLENNIFLRTRFRLTAAYIIILAVILLGYNIILYLDFKHDIADIQNVNKVNIEAQAPYTEGTIDGLLRVIIIEDIIVLSVSALISYILADYTLRPIQRSVQAQKTFSENASHELRTPLSIIKSDAEVLLRNANPTKEVMHTTLLSIVEEIDRMTDMTNDLLLLARSERYTNVVKEKINITNITRQIVDKIGLLAESKGIVILMDKYPSFNIIGDKSSIERVFLNLLQNAITYTPKGGSINIEIVEDKPDVIIHIIDTGSGISSVDLKHIFERFYKGENSPGTGLGLPIVKDIIDKHGGNVTIHSTKGSGTEVIIRLPTIV